MAAATDPVPDPAPDLGPQAVPDADEATDDYGVRFFDVVSTDGTRLRAWTNDADGPTVVLCNGLGTSPWAWPALLRPDCGVNVVSWYHRGISGSDRPDDPNRCGIEEFAEDAIAVMDACGIERAPLMGWSMGVNTMFEVAILHPSRVSGLFAVAGVPGATFSTMLGPFHLPRVLAELITVNASRALKQAGKALKHVSIPPAGLRTVAAVSHSGFMLPVADRDLAARAIDEMLHLPMDWYFHLALRTHRHGRVSLSRVQVPAMFVAGRYDVLAGARQMRSAAERMEDATYVELKGSHFLQMEHPDEVHAMLLDFLERIAS